MQVIHQDNNWKLEAGAGGFTATNLSNNLYYHCCVKYMNEYVDFKLKKVLRLFWDYDGFTYANKRITPAYLNDIIKKHLKK